MRMRAFAWAWFPVAVTMGACTCAGIIPLGDPLAGVDVCGKACSSDDACGPGYTCRDGSCAGERCPGGATGGSSGTVGGPDGGTAGTSASTAPDGGAPSSGSGSPSSAVRPSSSAASSTSMGPSSAGGSSHQAGSSVGGGASSSASGVASAASGSRGASSAGGSSSGPCVGGFVNATGACVPWTVCSGAQFESVPPTASRNRICSPLTTCSSAQFESIAPTPTSDRTCSPLTVCTSAEFESAPATPTKNRTCAALTTCTATQFESAPPAATRDRICTPLTICGAAEYQVAAPTPTSDRACAAVTGCTAQQYEILPPTPTSDRACLPLTACGSDQFQVTAPTPTSDRACALLTVCTAAQYESTPPTPTTDRACSAVTACTAAQYEVSPPTLTANRVCRAVTACTAQEYELAPPTATSDRSCRAVTTCSILQYELTAPTPTSDRTCAMLTVCSSQQYESVPPTGTTDRVCTPLTVCTSTQCETAPPTRTSDRACGPLVLNLTPAGVQTLQVNNPSAPPTATFQATACGDPVTAAWTLDVGALGTLSTALASSSVFTPSGRQGGLVTVIAGFQGSTARRQVFVQLVLPPQNGFTSAPAEAAQVAGSIAVLTRGGGVGGVGGEGLGPALASSDANLAALQGAPAGDGSAQGLKLLYPYDGTVWPRGMLAPLLQWEWSPGDADGVRIDLATTSGSYFWTGYFGRPAILAALPAANARFIRHPVPQDVWEAATRTAGGPTPSGVVDRLTVTLTVARAGVAYGPITQVWTVAPALLSGTIYYQSYGTNLADNYTGAQGTPTRFGAAVLAIRGGDTDPRLVSNRTDCQVCHSVAARGARLVVQAETNSRDDSWDYELTATAITAAQLARGVADPGYPALYPDGTLMLTPGGVLQSLPDNSGPDLAVSGLSTVTTRLGVPAFSPDGTRVVFNPQDLVTHPGRMLVVMTFNRATHAFTNPVVVSDDAVTSPSNADIRPAWPQFFPDSNALVYQHQLRAGVDGNHADAHTRKFARGEIYFAPAVASATVVPLRRLNGHRADGTTYLPARATPSTLACTADSVAVGANAGADGDASHTLDASYNYEPTVNPVSSGGYAWVVFTSRRLYGNVATIPPFCSDPRGVDLHADMVSNTNITPKKLWVAALDINPAPGADASHPAFYLPAQELLAGNARGFWVLDPCRADNESCATGDQCCNGFCQPNGTGGALVCSDRPPNSTCSNLQEACASATDCCLASALCINGFCAEVAN